MASIRRLKKDVDYLTFAVIADCMNYNSSVGKSEPEVVNIVKKMVEYRNETRSKISARKSFNDKKEARSYYKGRSIENSRRRIYPFERVGKTERLNDDCPQMFELPRSVVALFDDERRDCITGNR